MRKGNKTRLLIALLTVTLVISGTAFAQIGEVETDFGYVDVPNGLNEVESAEPSDGGEADGLFASVMADTATEPEPEVQNVSAKPDEMTGKVIKYNDKLYRITGTNNIAERMGAFDDNFGDLASSGDADVVIVEGNRVYNYNNEDGHNAPGCLELSSGTLIWRHYFDSGKLYVYSAWWKLDNSFNFDDAQRQLEGAYDPDTGASHMNEIGRNRAITRDWQQDLCVFRGNSAERRFLYVPANGGTVKLDDVCIYEVEEVDPFVIGRTFIEDDESWVSYNNIPKPGDYNCVIAYSANSLNPVKFNGVLVLFKDGKLYGAINQREIVSRTGTLLDGNLTATEGTVSIPFTIPEDEDVSKFKCVAFLGQAAEANRTANPFYVYGAANANYAAVINGAQG